MLDISSSKKVLTLMLPAFDAINALTYEIASGIWPHQPPKFPSMQMRVLNQLVGRKPVESDRVDNHVLNEFMDPGIQSLGYYLKGVRNGFFVHGRSGLQALQTKLKEILAVVDSLLQMVHLAVGAHRNVIRWMLHLRGFMMAVERVLSDACFNPGIGLREVANRAVNELQSYQGIDELPPMKKAADEVVRAMQTCLSFGTGMPYFGGGPPSSYGDGSSSSYGDGSSSYGDGSSSYGDGAANA